MGHTEGEGGEGKGGAAIITTSEGGEKELLMVEGMVEGEDGMGGNNNNMRGFIKVYWIALLFQLEANVILPTLWEFVKEHLKSSIIMYGAVLSVTAVFEVLGAILLGYWSDRKPIKYPMIAALLLFIIGNTLFIAAWDVGYWLLLISRAIAGMGNGGASIVLAYLTHHSSAADRNNKIALYWLISLSANIFGPLVTYLMALSHVGDDRSSTLNLITYPALFNIIFYSVNVLVVWRIWPVSASHHVSNRKVKQQINTDWGIEGVISLARSIPGLAFAIASPLTDSGTSMNSLMFVAIGALILFGVILAKLLNRKFSDYTTLQVGQVVAFISLFGLLRWPIDDKDLSDGIFGLASIALTLGNSIGITLCTAAYSKAIGQYHSRKGVLMGWFVTSAAFGRIIGPILSCIGLQTVGLNVVGGVLIGMSLVSLVSLSVSRLRMHYIQLPDEPTR